MPSGDLLSAATSLFYHIPPNTFRNAERKLLLETINKSPHIKAVQSHTGIIDLSSTVRVQHSDSTFL
jgi:hypothetical protein|eukprot:COSAG01_NODE_3218_length_6398_cov_5.380695_9_plen_67_part_00